MKSLQFFLQGDDNSWNKQTTKTEKQRNRELVILFYHSLHGNEINIECNGRKAPERVNVTKLSGVRLNSHLVVERACHKVTFILLWCFSRPEEKMLDSVGSF